MKKMICCCMVSMLLMGNAVSVCAASKDDAKISYVIKNVKLSKEESSKLKPVLASYYKDVATAKAEYKVLKDKLDAARDAGKLTAEQCDQLFYGKQKQDAAEMEVRKKYYAQFKTILSTQKAYEVIRLCNDKLK